jgi:DNA-directed RNA polymerase specialized sigma24 family protein
MNVSQADYHTHLSADDGYALFRRAIVEGDTDAWAEGWARYRRILISWAYRYSSVAELGESCEDIADQAFTRAWLALSPTRFDRFADLRALLAYFRACVSAVVIDQMRSAAVRERTIHKLDPAELVSPDQLALEEINRGELWQQISGMVANEQERVVLIESMVYGRPPREILARNVELFGDIAAVYTSKRNLITRLQRNPALRALCAQETD